MKKQWVCDMPWKVCREKGDPEEFTAETMEWIQTISNFLKNKV